LCAILFRELEILNIREKWRWQLGELNTKQVADRLGISEPRVRVLALERRVGRKFSAIWIFAESDVEKLRPKKTGRPRLK